MVKTVCACATARLAMGRACSSDEGFQSFDMGYASALTVLLFAVIMGVTLFQMKVLNRKVEY